MNGITSKLILAFVAILLGVVLLGSTASESNTITSKVELTNQTLDISGIRAGDLTAGSHPPMINSTNKLTVTGAGDTTADCPITNFAWRNDTNDSAVSSTNYNLSYGLTLGTFYIQATNATSLGNFGGQNGSNNTYINYTYCPTGYMNQAWGRTGLSTAIGLFAVAIMLVGVMLFYSAYSDWKKA